MSLLWQYCVPWVGKILWRRQWQPTSVLLPGESLGGRSVVGYSPWGLRVGCDWETSLHFTSLLWKNLTTWHVLLSELRLVSFQKYPGYLKTNLYSIWEWNINPVLLLELWKGLIKFYFLLLFIFAPSNNYWSGCVKMFCKDGLFVNSSL